MQELFSRKDRSPADQRLQYLDYSLATHHVVVGLLLGLLLLLLSGRGVGGSGGSTGSGRGGTGSSTGRDRGELGRALSDELRVSDTSRRRVRSSNPSHLAVPVPMPIPIPTPTLPLPARSSRQLTSLMSLPSSSEMSLESRSSSASMPTVLRSSLMSEADGEALPPVWSRR